MPKSNFNKVIKLLSNFTEIPLRHGSSPVHLLHIFRTPFSRNTSGWLLLKSVQKSVAWLNSQLNVLVNMQTKKNTFLKTIWLHAGVLNYQILSIQGLEKTLMNHANETFPQMHLPYRTIFLHNFQTMDKWSLETQPYYNLFC